MSERFLSYTTTIGTAAVIGALAMVYFSMKWRKELHKNKRLAHSILTAVVFGLFSIYASIAAYTYEGCMINCRTLAPLYAGLVCGPIAGIGAGLIGGIFRCFYGGGATAIPCAIACVVAGVIGCVLHKILLRNDRYTLPVGVLASLLAELFHMGITAAFGYAEVVKIVFMPITLSNLLGMAFCLYMYKCINRKAEK